jgi:hypothetical protein
LLKFLCNMVLESTSFLLRRKISIMHPHIHIAICNMHMGERKSNMHIAQKLSPAPKSKWAFRFKHTLPALAMAAPPPAAAEAAADGEVMVLDMTAQTEAVNGAYNNQPKGSDSGRNGSQGNGNSSSRGRGAYNNQPKSGRDSGRNGGRGSGNSGSHGRGKDSIRGVGSNVAPTALATTGAGNGRGRQQSTKKWQKWQSRQRRRRQPWQRRRQRERGRQQCWRQEFWQQRGQTMAWANNNQPKSGRMAVVVVAMVAAMTATTAAAMTAATAVVETKAAVAAVTVVPTVAEAVANVVVMMAETLSWQWLQQLQLRHIGNIVLLSTILK